MYFPDSLAHMLSVIVSISAVNHLSHELEYIRFDAFSELL
jgi:hypothetical protein